MAKKSPAKVKKLAAEVKRSAGLLRDARKLNTFDAGTNRSADPEPIDSQDKVWREIGLPVLARRALVDEGLLEISDLRKVSIAAVKELPGMNENSIRVLVLELKKIDLSFRS